MAKSYELKSVEVLGGGKFAVNVIITTSQGTKHNFNGVVAVSSKADGLAKLAALVAYYEAQEAQASRVATAIDDILNVVTEV